MIVRTIICSHFFHRAVAQLRAMFSAKASLLSGFATALLLVTPSAQAHKPSDSYLFLKVEKNMVHGQWDIALRDLDFAIGLDSDGNGELTWDEVKAKHQDIAAYAMSRLAIASGGANATLVNCPVKVGQQMLDQHTDGTYTVIYFEVQCADATALTVKYQLLFDIDPQHKGLLNLVNATGQTTTAIFSPDSAQQTFKPADASRWRQFFDYVVHGVWHIWIGFDHILFLLSLLLPAVLVQAAVVIKGRRWLPVASLKLAALEVVKIVTAFTLAHSLTLTLATLHVISLPSRWVESAIALSVILAALNNIYPVFRGRRWALAFAFGLIHGFGFASVLADLGLPQSSLALALVGFNAGVEVGQLTIVAVFLPLAFALRKGDFYQNLIFKYGSYLIALVAAVWFVERAFNLRLITMN